ncbi:MULTISPECIES: DUF1467 family protein [Maricaulis]|uniref:Uncharacterized protein n=1 Tax=Maricaulis maris (strain MCS10) TaxID=394221 RepID=Q0APX2_MARMM|nr:MULTISPECIES: DUF1467 family protein [Maricaulis]ABI65665.1 protein of unknown function DUF1467 [Maricaulis maris MCS10]MAC90623.1 DUF1467 domain-containing protein [Maricaulis sp.]
MTRFLPYLPVALAAIFWLKGFFVRDGGVGIVNGLVVFLIVWWLFFFTMLPIGVRSQEEAGDVVAGSEPGAPQAPNLKRKMWWTTIATSIVWIAYFLITESGVMEQFMPQSLFS